MTQSATPSLSRLIRSARGLEEADLVIRGGQIFDLITGALLEGDVAICGDRIVGTLGSYSGKRVIDATGLILVPGFIDTHLHIESSMVTPFEFERCVAPLGVTTAICDPHEIANVLGLEGIRYFQRASELTAIDLRVQISSCVPSSPLETTAATLSAADLAEVMHHPSAIGLAEMMNYPGVLHEAPEVMEKLELFRGRHIDGHAPLLSGNDLNGYIAPGIRTEHEATNLPEALEKLRKGLRVLIREGSVSKDLEALRPLLNDLTAPYMCLCTDDRNPLDIAEQGHLDYMIRRLIQLGVSPLAAYRAATLSAAEAFGLKDRGLIAPGKRADIVMVKSLEQADAQEVICGGRLLSEVFSAPVAKIAPVGLTSVKAAEISATDFRLAANAPHSDVIGIRVGQILTDHLHEVVPVEDGDKRPDTDRDLLRISVIERHGVNGNIGNGFVRGFGLNRGAIASTVCHDHHNIVAVGADYEDMALAANRLRELQGGVVVTCDGAVMAELALPVAGLMSLEPFAEVRDRLRALRKAAAELGTDLEEPFLQLAFVALPVIPNLKITDRGMVDVNKFELIG
ncbi:adenine deaminase [Epibacterium sp. Ofav1-8]|uniref:adenine deaminase n=1 Tax=Epibacterium sp. Ofav1-8 TaxID=2917735 RepID=UPI001EF5F93A|nr:adenine deaminase [Epibacterium sp. Ofav1-8]MCG7625095.1 adenine deaminase [Epibacterium sp. Ofav1-8]